MAKTKLHMELPKIGDMLKRIDTALTFPPLWSYDPKPCVVTYVNEAHHWYEVQFLETGYKECYNLPDFDHRVFKNRSVNGSSISIACIETGEVFPSIYECSMEMGLYMDGISKQLAGHRRDVNGYHFINLL